MTPFDKVTVDIEKDDITYTYGGTVICTYEKDSEEWCVIAIEGTDNVIHCKQNDTILGTI